MKNIVVTIQGIKIAVAFDDADTLTAKPKDAPAGRELEADTRAEEVLADFALYRIKNPERPEGFIDANDELVDWLRVTYGDDAVTFETDKGPEERVY